MQKSSETGGGWGDGWVCGETAMPMFDMLKSPEGGIGALTSEPEDRTRDCRSAQPE